MSTTTAPTTLAEALDALEALDPQGFEQDAAHDIIAEITGEAAAFGDSAPGSAEQLRNARAFLAELRAAQELVASLTPPAPRPAADEEPF